ncbi:MAG: LysM peptidoglycan-binding domain-containing protein [Verrucomicrobiota bacterium]
MKISEIYLRVAGLGATGVLILSSVACQNRPYTDVEDPYVYGDDYRNGRSGSYGSANYGGRVDPSYSENADVVRLEGDHGSVASNPYPDYGLESPAPSTPAYTPPTSASSSSASAGTRTHIVKAGENLYQIGRRYGTSSTKIKAANGLTSSIIHPNQRLIIP